MYANKPTVRLLSQVLFLYTQRQFPLWLMRFVILSRFPSASTTKISRVGQTAGLTQTACCRRMEEWTAGILLLGLVLRLYRKGCVGVGLGFVGSGLRANYFWFSFNLAPDVNCLVKADQLEIIVLGFSTNDPKAKFNSIFTLKSLYSLLSGMRQSWTDTATCKSRLYNTPLPLVVFIVYLLAIYFWCN